MPEIVQLLASPVHRYEGRPADGPSPAPVGELVDQIVLRKQLGLVADRYFGKPAHRTASVTVMAVESLPPAYRCAWMDVTIGPGTWKALRGKGGVRCVPLNDGVLRVGPVSVTVR